MEPGKSRLEYRRVRGGGGRFRVVCASISLVWLGLSFAPMAGRSIRSPSPPPRTWLVDMGFRLRQYFVRCTRFVERGRHTMNTREWLLGGEEREKGGSTQCAVSLANVHFPFPSYQCFSEREIWPGG